MPLQQKQSNRSKKVVDKQKKEEPVPAVTKDSSAMMELVPAATTTEVATDIQPAVASGDLWKPVISDLQALGEEHGQEDMSWIYIS